MPDLTVHLAGVGAIPAGWLEIPFSLTCMDCDGGQEVRSLEEAALAGWRAIVRDDGLGWNFLGYCPACGPRACGAKWRRTPVVELEN